MERHQLQEHLARITGGNLPDWVRDQSPDWLSAACRLAIAGFLKFEGDRIVNPNQMDFEKNREFALDLYEVFG